MFGHNNCSFTTGNNHGMSAKLLDEVSTNSVDYTTPQAGRVGVEGRGVTFVSVCVHVLWRAMRERSGTAYLWRRRPHVSWPEWCLSAGRAASSSVKRPKARNIKSELSSRERGQQAPSLLPPLMSFLHASARERLSAEVEEAEGCPVGNRGWGRGWVAREESPKRGRTRWW